MTVMSLEGFASKIPSAGDDVKSLYNALKRAVDTFSDWIEFLKGNSPPPTLKANAADPMVVKSQSHITKYTNPARIPEIVEADVGPGVVTPHDASNVLTESILPSSDDDMHAEDVEPVD